MAVSWNDSGARTGPHEIGLIANIAARNDRDAARRLYRKYRMELFRFGFHVLHDQGLAEEMVQETFIRFCQQARNYDTKRGPVRAWLFTMARSAAYDIARRPSSRPFLPVEDFQLPPQYDSVDQALTVLTVDQALDKLPSIYATQGARKARNSGLPAMKLRVEPLLRKRRIGDLNPGGWLHPTALAVSFQPCHGSVIMSAMVRKRRPGMPESRASSGTGPGRLGMRGAYGHAMATQRGGIPVTSGHLPPQPGRH